MTYTWPDVLTGLVRREGLEAEAAQWALSEILAGRASEVQLAALLVERDLRCIHIGAVQFFYRAGNGMLKYIFNVHCCEFAD